MITTTTRNMIDEQATALTRARYQRVRPQPHQFVQRRAADTCTCAARKRGASVLAISVRPARYSHDLICDHLPHKRACRLT